MREGRLSVVTVATALHPFTLPLKITSGSSSRPIPLTEAPDSGPPGLWVS